LRAGINPAPADEALPKSSGGVYPRPYWVPGNRNRSDSVILFIRISWDARDEYEHEEGDEVLAL